MKNLVLTFVLTLCAFIAHAQDIDAALKESVKKEGFLTFYYQESKGKIFAEINRLNEEFLYAPSMSRGLGSNDIGIDRGRLGQERILKWVKMGAKLFLIEPNYAYRASSADSLEKNAVQQSFASSVLMGFDILKNTDGRYIIDLGPLLLRDAMNAVQGISTTKQGTYSFDPSRSAIYAPMCKAFPHNTELEAMITFTGTGAGNYIREVSPNTDHLTLHQHISFVKLPDAGYKTRAFDPRMGYNHISFFDYSSPINEPITQRFITRHRLEKKDPKAAVSEAIKPIVYYLDPGTPEPIRTALLEGGRWWNQAFEAAGFKDAFQVKLLPADADPMDVRYNLVQWVHRSTRGWSYGMSFIDPRTGEIIKGKVTLGSLRVRQDYLIAQGLVGNYLADAQPREEDMLQMSLDRLMQLSAHEIGHTLGLPHNYISSVADRASVMDYPHPYFEEKDGKISLQNAYAKGIGAYDKLSIRYGYEQFSSESAEKIGLQSIIEESLKKGYFFLTDQDARPDGSLSPHTHLWDNGSDPSTELKRLMGIRAKVLADFGPQKLKKGTPLAQLEEVFVPMYMMHRFQVQAAAKNLAGFSYAYNLKDDTQPLPQPVTAAKQEEALQTLVATLQPGFLAVPQRVLEHIPPRPFGFDPNFREVFKRRTGMLFDPLAPAEASVQLTFSLLFEPKRLSRLAIQQNYGSALPSLKTMLSTLSTNLLSDSKLSGTDYSSQLSRLVADAYLQHLMQALADGSISSEAKAQLREEIKAILHSKNKQKTGFWLNQKDKLSRPASKQIASPNTLFVAPDGQPIDQDLHWLGCEDK
jgi:hypothetical protein